MKSRILIPISSAIFLGVGVLIGYFLFHGAGEAEYVVPDAPRAGDKPDASSSDGDLNETYESLVAGLQEKNRKLEEEIESLRAAVEKAAESKRSVPDGERPRSAPESGTPRSPGAFHTSRVNPNELKEGKGGLEGYLTNTDGTPAAETSLSLFKHTGDFKQWDLRTDSTGHFKKLGLTPGQYHISQNRLPTGTCKWPQRYLKVEAGKITRIDIGSPENINVSGKVLDANGKPVGNAFLHLFYHDVGRPDNFYSYSVQTDGDGRFVIENLKPVKYEWSLSGMNKVSYGFGHIRFSKEGPFEWNIELKATKLSGVVVDSGSGSPISKAHVYASLRGSTGSVGSSVRTDAEGRFHFEGLTAGTYGIFAYADRYVMKRTDAVKLSEGQILENIRIVLDPAAVVQVKVLDAEGKPIKDVDVELHTLDDRGKKDYWPLHFEVSGIAKVDKLPPGTYHFEVTAEGYASDSRSGIHLSLGDNPMIEFTLTKE
ncbi:MAG: carboxypeptidase regulatory-like domain-containing protein [Planctomycetota bacterium]